MEDLPWPGTAVGIRRCPQPQLRSTSPVRREVERCGAPPPELSSGDLLGGRVSCHLTRRGIAGEGRARWRAECWLLAELAALEFARDLPTGS